MISKSLSTSRRFAHLNTEAGDLAEFSQTLFTLLVVHADDFGRLSGDTFTIKHLVFPTSPRTLEHFDTALGALVRVGLIKRYSVNGNDYLEIERWDDHQTGLHKRTKSRVPEPQFPEIPGNSGNFQNFPAQLNRTKLNLTEVVMNKEHSLLAGSAGKPPAPTREFLSWFQGEYKKRRSGATYFVKWPAHSAIVKKLLTTFPEDRLKKHAVLLLTTNEEWTEGTDRGIEVLSGKINWLEERLSAWESKQKGRQSV